MSIPALTLAEKNFFDEEFKNLFDEFTKGVKRAFNAALDEPNQKQVQFSQQTYEAIQLSIITMAAHLGARITLAGERRSALEQRVALLEQRGTLEYRDVWAAETVYAKGDLVTFSGSLWIAKSASIGVKPGEGDVTTFWKLCVRRGRDGRDVR